VVVRARARVRARVRVGESEGEGGRERDSRGCPVFFVLAAGIGRNGDLRTESELLATKAKLGGERLCDGTTRARPRRRGTRVDECSEKSAKRT